MKEHTKKYVQRNTKNTKKTIKQKKGINDYQFYIGTNKQASEYETASEFVINYIKRTFDRGNDIAETLRTLSIQETEKWMPELKMSNETDEAIKTKENRQYELEYKAKLDKAIMRVDKYQQNLYKAYAFLWEKCSSAMQNKIMGRKDFDTNIYNDPIKLLKAIKEHSLNFQESKYEMSIITEAIKNFFNTKQKDNESLQEYTRRFKSAKDIMESHVGGPITLKKYIQLSTDYKEDLKQHQDKNGNENDKPNIYEEKYIKNASSKLYAYIYLDNADKSKYESILKNLNQQFSLGNNQYPNSIIEASSALNNHKFDMGYTKTKLNSRNQISREKENANETEEPILLTFAQIEGRCYCCGKPGHKSPQCKLKDVKPRHEWYINTVQLTQTKILDLKEQDSDTASTRIMIDADTNSTITKKSSLKKMGWTNLHYNLSNCMKNNEEELRNLVLLDSDSTNTIFCNEEYVENIQEAMKPLEIHTNGGTLTVTQTCEIPHLGKHWFNKDAITNIISLADISKNHRVTMDTAKEKSMIVHLDDKQVKFYQIPGGLYARKPKINEDENRNTPNTCGQNYLTVTENKKYVSNRQLKKAQDVKRLQNALGMPSYKDLKAIITMNMIKDNKITHEDINLAETIFGKSMGEIKGKTTRQNKTLEDIESINIPEELI